MIKKVHHMPLYVEDFGGNLEFLRETMGFPVVGTPVDEKEKVRIFKVGTDLIALLDEKLYKRRCVAAFLADSIEKELESYKKKGIRFAEISEIGDFEMKEGRYRYVFFRMKGKEKFNGGWIEMIEWTTWNP